jgi:hypothetical protein
VQIVQSNQGFENAGGMARSEVAKVIGLFLNSQSGLLHGTARSVRGLETLKKLAHDIRRTYWFQA